VYGDEGEYIAVKGRSEESKHFDLFDQYEITEMVLFFRNNQMSDAFSQ
jgi:hypothetical protein